MNIHCVAFLLGLLTVTHFLDAQTVLPVIPSQDHRSCELPIQRGDVMYYKPYTFRKGSRPKELTYAIDYLEDGRKMFGDTCLSWPAEAKTALEYAGAIWSDVLQNDQTINVQACYSPDMAVGTLGSARPGLQALVGFMGDTVIVPQALAENILRAELSNGFYPDIRVIINKNFNFYYGTDANPPSNQVDFVTLAVHELGHGLGFVGGAAIDDGNPNNAVECEGVADEACVGLRAGFSGHGIRYYPYVYDIFADISSDGSPLTDLPNPGPELRDELLGANGGLFFDESNNDDFYTGTETYQLYTPSTWQPGSSYSHFNDKSEALYYALSYGTAVHDVGKAGEVMRNIGWPKALSSASVLPVAFLSFDGEYEGGAVRLAWATATETDNDYFEVQVSRQGNAFRPLGRVAGAGNSNRQQHYRFEDHGPDPGIHHYRIRQVGSDGQESFSRVIGVRIAVKERMVGNPFPNPTDGSSLYLDYGSIKDQWVQVAFFGATGRVVGRFRRAVYPGTNRLTFDLSNQPAGLYTLMVEDGVGAVFRRVVVR